MNIGKLSWSLESQEEKNFRDEIDLTRGEKSSSAKLLGEAWKTFRGEMKDEDVIKRVYYSHKLNREALWMGHVSFHRLPYKIIPFHPLNSFPAYGNFPEVKWERKCVISSTHNSFAYFFPYVARHRRTHIFFRSENYFSRRVWSESENAASQNVGERRNNFSGVASPSEICCSVWGTFCNVLAHEFRRPE